MKKSNVIVFVLLALASAFFLWLWYFLGLNRVDEPLDLVLSIVWWLVIVVAIAVIVKMERTRRQRVRTVYVGDCATYNSEQGLATIEGSQPMSEVIAGIFDGLKAIDPASRVLGFLGGPSGLEEGKYLEITPEIMDAYRNTAGMWIVGEDMPQESNRITLHDSVKDQHGLPVPNVSPGFSTSLTRPSSCACSHSGTTSSRSPISMGL